MKDNSCRHCGQELEENKKCNVCSQTVQSFCHGCGHATEEQIHFQCMMMSKEKTLLTTN
jgi:hypothetical protein